MSEDKNCDLLFEYLRSILYDSQIQTLDVAKLEEPYQKLGLGLQFLERAVREMKTYSEALSRGNLSVKTPPRDNFLWLKSEKYSRKLKSSDLAGKTGSKR